MNLSCRPANHGHPNSGRRVRTIWSRTATRDFHYSDNVHGDVCFRTITLMSPAGYTECIRTVTAHVRMAKVVMASRRFYAKRAWEGYADDRQGSHIFDPVHIEEAVHCRSIGLDEIVGKNPARLIV